MRRGREHADARQDRGSGRLPHPARRGRSPRPLSHIARYRARRGHRAPRELAELQRRAAQRVPQRAGRRVTTKRTGTPWMASDAYGKTLTGLSLNLIVRDVAKSVPFYREVLGMTVHYADLDMAALQLGTT